MYEAKRRGKSGWVLFEAKMHQRVALAMSLENDLRHALKREEIRPVYQPIVHIASGRLVAFEVLARWTHPTRGVVSPDEFIGAAEEGGQIAVLGEFILRQSCQHFSHWRRHGLAEDVRLSVNLSRAQLSDTGLPQRIEQILVEASLPSNLLQLEITESLAMEDHRVRSGLDALRVLGIRLSLDDFGTGHSSLAALHRLPVQQVKIDRSFIADIETGSYHLAIVKAVLDVSRSLELDVVAEGVETQSQADILQKLGCSLAQGWLYAKAMESEMVPCYYGNL
jgi:EAL domain-containing protein (putative c-di-GMP-specific phosphodiesterase class I)